MTLDIDQCSCTTFGRIDSAPGPKLRIYGGPRLHTRIQNNNTLYTSNFFLFSYKLIIIYLFTATGLSPGGSGYFTCKQNTNLVTTRFKSGGLHEKHVVATWDLGNNFSICLREQINFCSCFHRFLTDVGTIRHETATCNLLRICGFCVNRWGKIYTSLKEVHKSCPTTYCLFQMWVKLGTGRVWKTWLTLAFSL